MKKTLSIAAAMILMLTSTSYAEDLIINAKVSKVVSDKLDKNGAPFAVIVIQEERTLSGVAYLADAPIFATGPAKDEALKVKSGDSLKAIVSKRLLNGDTVYALRKIVQ
jgi:hypothetical protein